MIKTYEYEAIINKSVEDSWKTDVKLMSKKKKIYIKAIATSLLKGAVLIATAVGIAITLKSHMIISLLIAIAGAVCFVSLKLLFNYLVDEYEKEL